MRVSHVCVLIADDDPMLRDLYARTLTDEGYETLCAATGTEALSILTDSPVDVLLCDLNMPGLTGMELLPLARALRPDMAIILITGLGTVDAARHALHEGASDFITKPCPPRDLPIVVERNLTRQVAQRMKSARRLRMPDTSNEGVLDALLSALDARDTETEGHSERVTAYTMEMADRLRLRREEIYHIERGALLHDIGKIGVPDRILLKPSSLTTEEWFDMRKHPLIGHRMCARIPLLQRASEIVLHHHERWDGKGYPHGLAGEEIPLGARIFAIADALDAMTSDRPYRAALPFADAFAEIVRQSGTQFDPALIAVFRQTPELRWTQIRTHAEQNRRRAG